MDGGPGQAVRDPRGRSRISSSIRTALRAAGVARWHAPPSTAPQSTPRSDSASRDWLPTTPSASSTARRWTRPPSRGPVQRQVRPVGARRSPRNVRTACGMVSRHDRRAPDHARIAMIVGAGTWRPSGFRRGRGSGSVCACRVEQSVGGVEVNKARARAALTAVLAPGRLTGRVYRRRPRGQDPITDWSRHSPVHTAGRLRPAQAARQATRRQADRTRCYNVPGDAARTIAALLSPREQVIAPILAGVRRPRPGRPRRPTPVSTATMRTSAPTCAPSANLAINAAA